VPDVRTEAGEQSAAGERGQQHKLLRKAASCVRTCFNVSTEAGTGHGRRIGAHRKFFVAIHTTVPVAVGMGTTTLEASW
jgi:hypothetical protein